MYSRLPRIKVVSRSRSEKVRFILPINSGPYSGLLCGISPLYDLISKCKLPGFSWAETEKKKINF